MRFYQKMCHRSKFFEKKKLFFWKNYIFINHILYRFQSVFSQYKNIVQYSSAELLSVNENRMEDDLMNLSKADLIRYKFQYITAASFFGNGTVVTWFNGQALHSAPLSLNLMHNAIAKAIIGNSSSIHVKNAPFKHFPKTQSTNSVLQKYGFTLAIFIGIAMGIYSPAYFSFYIQVNLNLFYKQKILYFWVNKKKINNFSIHFIQIGHESIVGKK